MVIIIFLLDIETLSTESTAVVLNAAMVYFEDGMSYNELLESSLLVKFDAKEQIRQYKRHVSKDTLDWWGKQSEEIRNTNFNPSCTDLAAAEGILRLKEYMNISQEKTKIIFTRGALDPMCLESLCRAIGVKPLAPYYNFMDVRTALNLMKSTTVRGYCDVDVKGFDMAEAKKNKHDPIVDVCLDAMQILYGI